MAARIPYLERLGRRRQAGSGRPEPTSVRRGVILVIVLVVVAVLSLSALTFTELMITNRQSVELSGRQLQCQAFVDSGVEWVRMYLIQDELTREESGGHYDNPEFFQAQPILLGLTPQSRGNFSVLTTSLDELGNPGGVRFGLEDESTRLNVNALLLADQVQENGGRTLLMCLPGMSEDLADAIMDWIDEDEEPREFGCESEYYQQLSPPYSAKNGPLDTVEELLLVRGVLPTLLFGLDTNRNGIIDMHEMSESAGILGAATGPTSATADPTAGDLSLQRGWSAYLTLYSLEKNTNAQGLPRIFLNQESMEDLYQQLSEVVPVEWATFIVAYRQFGPYDGDEEGEPAPGELDLSQPGQTQITQVLDLIGKKVQARFSGSDGQTVLASPFPEDLGAMALYLPTLMDNCTINEAPVIPGRINVNQAPRSILLGIPGITEEVVDTIIQERAVESDDESFLANYQHETWLLTSGIVTLDEMKTMVPFVTAGGDVFRTQVVGYFEDGGASARAEVVLDATGATPRIVSWRNISHLGRGYPLEVLGLQLFPQ